MSNPTPATETDTTQKGPGPLLLLLLLAIAAALAWYFFVRDQREAAPPADTTPTVPVEIGDDSAAARDADAREAAAGRERTRRSPESAAPTAPVASVATPIAAMSPRPEYPAEAMRRNETGRVLLRVDVGADGIPTDIDFVHRSGSQSLDRAAMDAVREWRFTPARKEGRAVAGQVTVPMDFVLPPQD